MVHGAPAVKSIDDKVSVKLQCKLHAAFAFFLAGIHEAFFNMNIVVYDACYEN